MTTAKAILLQADAARLPFEDGAFDMVIGSPPYCDARLYLENGQRIGADRKPLAWVEWMLAVTTEALRVSRGPVIWVACGKTEDRNYWPACEGLMWEWWKRGGHAYRPVAWTKNGIPGSGGDQWFRADWEFCMCFKRPGKLPWSDNTACGHEPVYASTGAMSNRGVDGLRVGGAFSNNHADGRARNIRTGSVLGEAFDLAHDDPWGKRGRGNNLGGRHKTGGKKLGTMMSNRRASGERKTDHTKREPDGTMRIQKYAKPKLANPGNVLHVDTFGLNIIETLVDYGIFIRSGPDQVLRDMRAAISSGSLRRWWAGILARVYEASLLQSGLQGHGPAIAERAEARRPTSPGPEDRETPQNAGGVREVRDVVAAGGSSQGRGRDQQRPVEPPGPVLHLPSQDTQDRVVFGSRLHSAIQGERVLLHALVSLEEVWRSLGQATQPSLETAEGGDVMRVEVGGGRLGSAYAHLNEAPYPEGVPEFFIKSLCPAGGVVFDPFLGSGTTPDVALRLGRRAVGIDFRLSQCVLAAKRVAEPHVVPKPVKVPKQAVGQLSIFGDAVAWPA